MPHYILGKIEREKIFLRPEPFFREKAIETFFSAKVVSLKPTDHAIELSTGETLHYGKLLIAAGAEPLPLPTVFENSERITAFRTLSDAERIKTLLADDSAGREAAVLGASFISLEFPPFFEKYGFRGHLILRGERIFWRVLDAAASEWIEKEIARHGTLVHKNSKLSRVEDDDRWLSLRLSSGEDLKVVFLGYGLGLGAAPDFALKAGLKGGARGVVTDEYLRTGAPDIWAAGDCAECYDIFSKRSRRPANWMNAEAQGCYAAAAMVNEAGKPFEMFSIYSLRIFNLAMLFLGDLTESQDSKWIDRGGPVHERLARIHLRNGKIVGAVLVNAASELKAVKSLIEQRANLANAGDNLTDLNFDLQNFLT